jgi:hypothetical protein
MLCKTVWHQALCKVVPELKSIKLPGCYNVGTLALSCIGAGCHKLEYIDLSLCPKINAAGLTALTAGCKHLTYLCLRGCDGVDDSALRALAKNAPQLVTINLSGTATVVLLTPRWGTGIQCMAFPCRH